MKNVYVVTGGPGFGKTSVLTELRKQGYSASEELSRQFIKEQMEGGEALLPWINRLGYSEEMLRRRIRQFEQTPVDELWFFDRGIPDLSAYITKDGLIVPDIYHQATQKYRYQETVFLTPPWKEIHVNDTERHESFEEAVAIHAEIERAYVQAGYKCIALPQATIAERTKFILDAVL